jgi:hypothetical protein
MSEGIVIWYEFFLQIAELALNNYHSLTHIECTL